MQESHARMGFVGQCHPRQQPLFFFYVMHFVASQTRDVPRGWVALKVILDSGNISLLPVKSHFHLKKKKHQNPQLTAGKQG